MADSADLAMKTSRPTTEQRRIREVENRLGTDREPSPARSTLSCEEYSRFSEAALAFADCCESGTARGPRRTRAAPKLRRARALTPKPKPASSSISISPSDQYAAPCSKF